MKLTCQNLTVPQKLGLIVLLSLILSVHGLWVPFYNNDELTNAIYARFINQGELSLKDFLGSTYFLTHYLYVWVYRFVDANTLIPFHVVHAFWKVFTVLALYWAGKSLDGERTGIFAALFYCVFSTCFMSKDFHTPSSESLSLLPAALCAGFVFRAVETQRIVFYFVAGVFAALATLFKVPMGVIIVAVNIMLLTRGHGFFKKAFLVNAGFLLAFFFPAALVTPFGEGFRLIAQKMSETNTVYIQSYEGFAFLYWFLKYLIRTALVLGSCLVLTVFAFFAMRMVFRFTRKRRDYWHKLFFLFVWCVLLWFTVTIGKRVFYHYFVFLLAPLSLLAGTGIKRFDLWLRVVQKKQRDGGVLLGFMGFVRRYMAWFMALPAVLFFVEGSFNYSLKRPDVDGAIRYIQKATEPDERIYVWGYVPSLYFYGRLPATVHFWSMRLAQTSHASPAMEYVRATRARLSLSALLAKDFKPQPFEEKDPNDYLKQETNRIDERELFTMTELLETSNNPYWQKVFADFLNDPPVLFIDSSPANIHGFGHYPIFKYDLLKRFVWENYEKEAIIDGLIIYRLKGQRVGGLSHDEFKTPLEKL